MAGAFFLALFLIYGIMSLALRRLTVNLTITRDGVALTTGDIAVPDRTDLDRRRRKWEMKLH